MPQRWDCAVCRKWIYFKGTPKRWAGPGGDGWICAACIPQEISDLKKIDAEEICKTELAHREAAEADGGEAKAAAAPPGGGGGA